MEIVLTSPGVSWGIALRENIDAPQWLSRWTEQTLSVEWLTPRGQCPVRSQRHVQRGSCFNGDPVGKLARLAQVSSPKDGPGIHIIQEQSAVFLNRR